MKKLFIHPLFVGLLFWSAASVVRALTEDETRMLLGNLETRAGVLETKLAQAEGGTGSWSKVELSTEWLLLQGEAASVSEEVGRLTLTLSGDPVVTVSPVIVTGASGNSVPPSGQSGVGTGVVSQPGGSELGVALAGGTTPSPVTTPPPVDVSLGEARTPPSSSIRTRQQDAPSSVSSTQIDPSRTTQGADTRAINAPDISVSGLIFSGESAGGGDIKAGDMAVSVTVQNSGSVSIEKAFVNVFQYAEGAGGWTDWVKFEIPRLTSGGNGEAKYEWNGGAGDWSFRFCADSDNTVFEANEYNNCTNPVFIRIVQGADSISPLDQLPPASQEGGVAKLLFHPPLFSNVTAKDGKYFPGLMTLLEEITNTGTARSSPISGVWQYATGAVFTDWIRVELPALNPGRTAVSRYSWEGGRGMWRFRFCVAEAVGGTRKCSNAIFVEIQ